MSTARRLHMHSHQLPGAAHAEGPVSHLPFHVADTARSHSTAWVSGRPLRAVLPDGAHTWAAGCRSPGGTRLRSTQAPGPAPGAPAGAGAEWAAGSARPLVPVVLSRSPRPGRPHITRGEQRSGRVHPGQPPSGRMGCRPVSLAAAQPPQNHSGVTGLQEESDQCPPAVSRTDECGHARIAPRQCWERAGGQCRLNGGLLVGPRALKSQL